MRREHPQQRGDRLGEAEGLRSAREDSDRSMTHPSPGLATPFLRP
jgi:hypothetical protein